MFNGTSFHNLDGKGRLAIPTRFRAEEADAVSRLVLLNAADHLVVYPYQHWENIATKLNGLSQLDPRVQAVRRYFIASAADCESDRQGRILLPPASRQGLSNAEVALVGMGLCFEIWDKEAWLNEQARVLADMETLGSAVAELGI